MALNGKKLGLVVCSAPEDPLFRHALGLAEAAVAEGLQVYLYYMDEGVRGLGDEKLKILQSRGANLFACAYSAQRRNIPINDAATFSGLAWLSNLLAASDRFLLFP